MMLHPIKYFLRRGSGTERYVFQKLRKIGIPKNQIFRNVYVPKYDGKFSEIDILVLSKKGFLVFECKDYGGKIYGDGRKATWTQFLGGRRYTFLNPAIQNAGHIKYLLKHFRKYGFLPAESFIVPSNGGEWHLKNLRENVYFLQKDDDFAKIYRKLKDSPLMARHFYSIMKELRQMEKVNLRMRARHKREIHATQKQIRSSKVRLHDRKN